MLTEIPERRYDEKEVGAILQRAGEIKADLSPAIHTDGLTLEELKRVAGEVGIESEIVERAALEVSDRVSKGTKPSGALMLDQTIEGALSEEAWVDATMNLRHFVGKPGTISIHESTREWSGGWDLGNVTLFATTRQGKTRVRMLADTTGLSTLAWTIGSTVGLLGSLMTSILLRKNGGLDNLTSLLCALFVISLVAGIIQTMVKVSQRKVRQTLEDQFAQIVARVEPEPMQLNGSSQTTDEATQTVTT